MKKLVLLMVAVILGMGAMFANPVDVNKAKTLGQKFVQAKFEMTRSADLQLYYTVTSDNGAPCAYVFNMGNEGFVIVAAADNVRPILGYSNDGPFDASNPHNGAMFMLETYKNSISYAIENNIKATPDIVGMWASLENSGRLSSNRGGKKVGPLVWTKWNQDSPYNLYAPATQGGHAGAGGRCYAGCVATAMGQVMRYWAHPITGNGSHSYNCVGYGPTYYQYGIQSANFGATTYQWDLMPRTLSGASQEQIEAVATLLYHCGVSVDMTYDWDGSGTYSDLVPGAMSNYFDYGHCQKVSRNSYTLNNWVQKLKDEFDLGRPVYYSGQSSSGGHAFVADGYDEDDFIHFNFGWSGSDDNFYQVDAIEYSSSAAAIFNYVPNYVYDNTLQAPTNVTAVKTSETAQEATISWKNPDKNASYQTVSTIDQIILVRDGRIIHTVDNPTPGADMSFVDSDVPCYSTFTYKVYGVKDGVIGMAGKTSETFGPTCAWKIVATTTNMNGWKGGYLVSYDATGSQIDAVTMTDGNPLTYNMNMPIGRVYFAWKAGTENISLGIRIKDATGATVYEYQGNSNDIPSGVLYECNNGCGNVAPVGAPEELVATEQGNTITLTWQDNTNKANNDIDYGYNIYRDELLVALVHNQEFVDEFAEVGGHCYRVCILSDGGESDYSNEVCATAGEGCNAPRNEWFYLQANGKPVITWDAPETAVTGYYVYRKTGEDGVYAEVKILPANKTEYKETQPLTWGNYYFYRVVAYYEETDCYSAPAKAMYGNEYFVMVHYSQEGLEENMAQNVEVFPNPAKDNITVKADDLTSVVVYNSIGQKVYEQTLDANEVAINTAAFEPGMYFVRIVANGNEVTRKISVVK